MAKRKPAAETTEANDADAGPAEKRKRAASKYIIQKQTLDEGGWTWIDIMDADGPKSFDTPAAAEAYADGAKEEGRFRIVTVRKCFVVAKTETLAKTYE